MIAHNPAAVHVPLDAGNASGGRVLPHEILFVVIKYRPLALIFGYHPVIARELAAQVFVVEVLVRI